ncbi:unnamed protein product [Brachionus calyciflorus]|uniref:Nuclear receptor domain-containing protein n=1 Tax=Brachionus calyciflorus TaxID=104777 RepID=A0A813XDN9_9BILA|nr:unnamed protein product [Brachionus calyciflorus]
MSKILSDEEVFKALSYEYFLNNQRSVREQFQNKFNFGQCKVCSDKATGIHYGTSSCEGCKGFFKRSILKHKKYVCRGQKNCRIYPKQRKKCKYCRWNLSIKAGMSLKCVRMGRIPNHMKIIKPKIELKNPNYFISLQYMLKLSKLDHIFKEAKAILPQTYNSEKFLNESTENQIIVLSLLRDKTLQIFREQTKEFESQEIRALKLIEYGYETNQFELGPEQVELLKKKDLSFLETHARSMFRIIEDLPGFQRFSKDDVRALINANFFTILGFRTVRLFINGDYFFMLDSNCQMNGKVFGLIMGEKIRDNLFKYYSDLSLLRLTNQEIGLLIPFSMSLLTFNVDNKRLLNEINEYYLRALYKEFSLNRRTREFLENFAKVVANGPKINKMCQDIWLEDFKI